MNRRRYNYHAAMTLAMTVMAWHGCVWAISFGGESSRGNLVLTPVLNTQLRYDSNIFTEDTKQVSSLVSVTSASLDLKRANSSAGYQMDRGLYRSSSADNYLDHTLRAGTGFGLSENLAADIFIGYKTGHESRGSGFSQGAGDVLDTPDKYSTFDRSMKLDFGSEHSQARLITTASLLSRDYQNHSSTNALREHSISGLSVALHRQVSVKTTVLFEYGRGNVFYAREEAKLDSVQENYFAGIQWQYSVLTSGVLKGGWHSKTFQDVSRENHLGWGWSLDASWTPGLFTTLEISSNSSTSETNGTGDYIQTRQLGLGIGQVVFGRINLSLDTAITLNAYLPGAARDGVVDVTAGLDFDIRSWLAVGMAYTYYYRDANRTGLDARRSIVNLQLQVHR